jgi:hypothetical protein
MRVKVKDNKVITHINTDELMNYLISNNSFVNNINPNLKKYILIKTIEEKIVFERLLREISYDRSSIQLMHSKICNHEIIDLSDGIVASFNPIIKVKKGRWYNKIFNWFRK